MLHVPSGLIASVFALMIVAASRDPEGLCDSDSDVLTDEPRPALGTIEASGGSPESTAYVDDRNFFLGNGIWIYAESNGIWAPKLPGVYANDIADHDLQRGGCARFGSCEFDPQGSYEICTDDWTIEPDTLLF